MANVIAICGALILLDVVSGVLAAVKNNELSSSKMRNGLFNKAGELLLLGLSWFLNFMANVPPLDQMGIPSEVLYSIGAYIGVMEIVSVVENVCKMNPDLPFARILEIFNIPVDETRSHMVKSESAPEE